MNELPIAELDLPGGGRLGIAPLPGTYQGLAGDVARISLWRAQMVVSLTEADEMQRLGCGDLGEACRTAGLDWRHLPVRDYGVPAGAAANLWPELARDLHAVLDGRGAILVHCRGGLGRSGMIALRLMVERGEVPDQALLRLRAARPGAVETDAQFAWAADGIDQPGP